MPARMASISCGDFSGKAATRLLRAMRCSRNQGLNAVRMDAGGGYWRGALAASAAHDRHHQRSRGTLMGDVGFVSQVPLELPPALFERRLARAVRTAQSVTTILPNTWRLSSRAMPSLEVGEPNLGVDHRSACRPPSCRGCRGCCFMEAPNEPKILYCCWNSCIRLKVVDAARRSSRR